MGQVIERKKTNNLHLMYRHVEKQKKNSPLLKKKNKELSKYIYLFICPTEKYRLMKRNCHQSAITCQQVIGCNLML